jgi:hypothetical protein
MTIASLSTLNNVNGSTGSVLKLTRRFAAWRRGKNDMTTRRYTRHRQLLHSHRRRIEEDGTVAQPAGAQSKRAQK